MRILVAEDDAVLADAVQRSLRQSGHAVDWVQNGAQADCALAAEQFDLLILDLGLPKKSGIDVLKRLRAGDSHLPVLILTALDGVTDRVRGLDAGADDYLAKPFDLAELEARVRALTRRGMSGGSTLLRHGALAYDQVGRVASLNGAPLELSGRELNLLEALRTLRLMHYSAWIARRWDDPAFPAAFPWFNTQRYWQDRILELREQIALMQEEPLRAD